MLHWADEEACARAARALAKARPEDAVITLEGDLGAGKTTFTRFLLQALGVQGRIKSPTYAVMETYDVGWPVAHFDFYRFRDPQEWEDAGFRDVFSVPGLKLCEWPEKAQGLMPVADLAIRLTILEDCQRQAALQAHTDAGRRLLRALMEAHDRV